MHTLNSCYIKTPIGEMLAIGDDQYLYLLKFAEQKHTQRAVTDLKKASNYIIQPGCSASLTAIKHELAEYFKKNLQKFSTPVKLTGTSFQQQTWRELIKIPYAKTISYRQQAIELQHPNSYRAVANANGRNKLEIIVPCHRVISSSGTIGGYSAGLDKKKWLLSHENCYPCIAQI